MEEIPTNELIEQLRENLTPQARAVLEELEAATFDLDQAAGDEAIRRARRLPHGEWRVVRRVLELRAEQYRAAAKEAEAQGEDVATLGGIIDRAQALLRLEGREPPEGMTLRDALEVLERHGEQPD